jgi:hypothetical protein
MEEVLPNVALIAVIVIRQGKLCLVEPGDHILTESQREQRVQCWWYQGGLQRKLENQYTIVGDMCN